MFGRGLVHPPDMQHPENPAFDPQLLNDLAQRFATMKFDIRAFLREIALSNTYQRSFDLPPNALTLTTQVAAEVANLEQQRASVEQAATTSGDEYTNVSETWQAAEAAMLPVAAELDAARTKYTEEKGKYDAAVKAVADAAAAANAKQALLTPVETAAAAAIEASTTISEDKALAETAQKVKAKADQLAAELAALKKTLDEKTAAVKPAEDALAAAKPAVEAAYAKVTPLVATMKQDEEAMLAARRKNTADKELLTALQRRLETSQVVARLPEVNKTLVAAKEAITARQAEVAAAGKQVADFAAIVADHEQKVKAASDAIAAATSTRDAARVEHEKRTKLSESLTAAFTSADAARQKVPDDTLLAEAATKLQARAELARNQIGESQKLFDEAAAAYKKVDDAFIAAQETLAAALAERARREQTVESTKAALAAAEAEAAKKQSEFDTLLSGVTERWGRDFTMASLKPLTPEQLCWTVFRVTGVYDRYWQTEVAELDKANPMTEEQKKDPAQVAAREVELEQRTFDKLKDNVNTFVAFYGAAAGQPQGDFFSTADQALFAANGGSINSWVVPAGDNVTDRIIKQEDPKAAAEELYLAVLTRPPTEAEAIEVITHLANRKDNKPAAAQELVWALLNSAEFRFNH
jgi:chromosome segregation ATPase